MGDVDGAMMTGSFRTLQLPKRAAIALSVLGLLASTGCKEDLSKRYLAVKRDLMERELGEFDPRFLEVPGHFAIPMKVENGELEQSGLPEARPGPFPYRSETVSGDTLIEWLDKNGVVLGSYRIDDPLRVRACGGPNDSDTRILDNGYLEILLALDQGIDTLRIQRPRRETTELVIKVGRNQLAPF